MLSSHRILISFLSGNGIIIYSKTTKCTNYTNNKYLKQNNMFIFVKSGAAFVLLHFCVNSSFYFFTVLTEKGLFKSPLSV